MGIENRILELLKQGKDYIDIRNWIFDTYNPIEAFIALKDNYSSLNGLTVVINNEDSFERMTFENWLYIQIERLAEEEAHKILKLKEN